MLQRVFEPFAQVRGAIDRSRRAASAWGWPSSAASPSCTAAGRRVERRAGPRHEFTVAAAAGGRANRRGAGRAVAASLQPLRVLVIDDNVDAAE